MTSPDGGQGQAPPTGPVGPVRVALDLLGGDGGAAAMTAAVVDWLRAPRRDDVQLVLVGPTGSTREALAGARLDPDDGALSYVGADRVVAMADAPVAAVRRHTDLGVRVACELVRDGAADAVVSAGHTGALVAATSLVWGRAADAARPALAVLVPGTVRPVLLLDAGASPDVTAEVLVSHARLGLAHAVAAGTAERPTVGLLSIGAERGKGDALRRAADPLLRAALGDAYVGPVEGHDVSSGASADVVVTDGFTGNVLLKGLEGAVSWTVAVTSAAYPDRAPALAAVGHALAPPYGAGVLLGVRGAAVAAHGSASSAGVRAAIAHAVLLARRTRPRPATATVATMIETGTTR